VSIRLLIIECIVACVTIPIAIIVALWARGDLTWQLGIGTIVFGIAGFPIVFLLGWWPRKWLDRYIRRRKASNRSGK